MISYISLFLFIFIMTAIHCPLNTFFHTIVSRQCICHTFLICKKINKVLLKQLSFTLQQIISASKKNYKNYYDFSNCYLRIDYPFKTRVDRTN